MSESLSGFEENPQACRSRTVRLYAPKCRGVRIFLKNYENLHIAEVKCYSDHLLGTQSCRKFAPFLAPFNADNEHFGSWGAKVVVRQFPYNL